MRHCTGALRASCTIGLFVGLASAVQASARIPTLKGVQCLTVVVEDVRPELKPTGLTTEGIRTDVELQIREAGLEVLPFDEAKKRPGCPLLYVNLNGFVEKGQAFYSLWLELDQPAVLLGQKDGPVCYVGTWTKSSLGRKPPIDLRATIKENVATFVSDYLSVNPKSKP